MKLIILMWEIFFFFFTKENSVNGLFIGNAVILLPLFVHLIVKLFIISYLYTYFIDNH